MNSRRMRINFNAFLHFIEQVFFNDRRNRVGDNYILETVFADVFAIGQHVAHAVVSKRFCVRLSTRSFYHTNVNTHAASVHIVYYCFDLFAVGIPLKNLAYERRFAFVDLQTPIFVKVITERSYATVRHSF